MFINKIKSKEINKKINKLNQLNRTHQTIKGKNGSINEQDSSI